MTHEEAARILDPETSAEALREYGDGTAQIAACDEACRIAADVLRGKHTGEALTMEQLRKMDGQPVWVKCLNSKKYTDPPTGWRIMERSITGTIGVWNGESCFAERDYGVDWLAYAYMPAHIDREAYDKKDRLQEK